LSDPLGRAALLWALLPLFFLWCRDAPAPRGACDPPRNEMTRGVCSKGPDAADGAARLLFGGRLEANEANAGELALLPGIGPRRGAAISQAAQERPFGHINDLERVRGVGPMTIARVRPWLRVAPGIAEQGSSPPPSRRGEP
jgi:competence protein ComEA